MFGEEGTPYAGMPLCQSCYYKTLVKRKLRYERKRKNQYSKRNQYRRMNLYKTELSEESKELKEGSEAYLRKGDKYKLSDEKTSYAKETEGSSEKS
jgi:hypothetical protein